MTQESAALNENKELAFFNSYNRLLYTLDISSYSTFLILDKDKLIETLEEVIYYSRGLRLNEAKFIQENKKSIKTTIKALLDIKTTLLKDLESLSTEYKKDISEKIKYWEKIKSDFVILELPDEINLEGYKTAIEIYLNRAKTAYYYASNNPKEKTELFLYSYVLLFLLTFIEAIILPLSKIKSLNINPSFAFNALNIIHLFSLVSFSFFTINNQKKKYTISFFIIFSYLTLASFSLSPNLIPESIHNVLISYPLNTLFFSKGTMNTLKTSPLNFHLATLIKNALSSLLYSSVLIQKERKREVR